MPVLDIPADVALLAGPQLFGHLFNYGLFGILTIQVYFYHLAFPTDHTRLKVLIYTLYIVECIQVILASHDAYKVLGGGWGDIDALTKTHYQWIDSQMMTGIVSAIVQCYFSWRIYVLSTSANLAAFISLVALTQGCAAIVSGVRSHMLDNNSRLQEETLSSSIVWLVGSATCDILIAGCMLYFLMRGRQGLASDALLARLIRLTVETGSLTASVACLDLILFVAFKHNNLHMMPALVLTKVYTNSLMMHIHNRAQMRMMMMRGDGTNFSPPLQWVIGAANVDGGSGHASSPRENEHELVSFKTPVIEAFPDNRLQVDVDDDSKLQIPTSSKSTPTPRSSINRASTNRSPSLRISTVLR